MLPVKARLTDNVRTVFIVIGLLSIGSSQVSHENDLDLDFRGTWLHDKGPLSLHINLSTGCKGISISANKTSLSIHGQITSHCRRFDVIRLQHLSENESKFYLYWEPLLDQMKLQVGDKTFTLCWPVSLRGSCCTDLSPGPNEAEGTYGIINGSIRTDIINQKTLTAYTFKGQHINCSTLCEQALKTPSAIISQGTVRNEHVCARRSELEIKEDFKGYDVTLPATFGTSTKSNAIVHLPAALKQAAKKASKVVLTFFKNNSLFQEGYDEEKVLNDVVEITVENEIITDLSESIKITFHHDTISRKHSRKCVSWDTRKDPLQVSWRVDGCQTEEKNETQTECLCNHLTYFAVLVQLEPRPVRYLLVLTVITSLGCAVSVISCVGLIIYLCWKRRAKEQSTPIHLGLAVSLCLLNLLFFFTGVLANAGGESVCTWVGAGLHYSLLSSLTWMGIQVFHTFWLVYRVFKPPPTPYIWIVVGFVLPAVPVTILACIGDIYGISRVEQSDDLSNPYLMCWMKNTEENNKALLAHYFTNIPILIILVVSGIGMLFVVYREIKTREEWRKNQVAFLSIWGLSCLFGTTWGLAFLDFGPFSDFTRFLFCFLNSFQGFFLMLRFYMLVWMRKQAGDSAFGSSSTTGSTRQHMLQCQEKTAMT